MAATVTRGHSRRKLPSTPSTATATAVPSSLLKQVFLHDWWLIKVNSDSERLGIGGFTSKEGQCIRSFSSAPIVKRHDAVTLKTLDDITIMVHGHLNRSRSIENGFSHEICNHFLIGFPYYWEEFTVISIDEELAHAYKTHSSGDNGSSRLSRNIFDDILQQSNANAFTCSGASVAKKESSQGIRPMVSTPGETPSNQMKRKAEHTGPSTRSRSRLPEHTGPTTRSKTRLQ